MGQVVPAMKSSGNSARYHGDITAGSLKVAESRVIADLLLQTTDPDAITLAIRDQNLLQTRSAATATRLGYLLVARLQTMDAELWAMIRDGGKGVATHACMAAAIKHSALLGDFMDLVLRDQYKVFAKTLRQSLWMSYIEECRARDPDVPTWSDLTIKRLRSSVFQMLAQAGYLDSTRSLQLQRVHVAREVLNYLHEHEEEYVLRCMQVGL